MFPILFVIPGADVGVPSYVVFGLIGLAIGWLVMRRLAIGHALPTDRLASGYIAAALFGVFAGRISWLLANPEQFGTWTRVIAIGDGHLSFAGGLAGATLIAVLHAHRHGILAWRWLDCAAPALLLAVVCERVGALLAGSDFGSPVAASFAWGVRYPAQSLAFVHQARIFEGLRELDASSVPVHAVQIYVAAVAAVGAISLTRMAPALRSPGTATGVALLVSALGVYGVGELFAGQPSDYVVGGLRGAHAGGLLCTAMGLLALRRRPAADERRVRSPRVQPGSSRRGKRRR